MDLDKRTHIDLLIEEFWKKGYLTLFRKYGTYLPEPHKIGDFEVDVIARYKDTFAIGITLIEQDLKDKGSVKNKLVYLAHRQSRNKNKKVQLFVGVSSANMKTMRLILDELDIETRKNIRLFQINEKNNFHITSRIDSSKVLFS